jgi:hypothetical protein
LYGVDKNIMAVDLAKLSLWLVTLAKDHPFTFLDHSLRHGDSLVGLTREQIIGFHWEPKKQMKFGEDLIQKRLDRATEARAKILSAREDVAYRDQEQRMAVADEALNLIRLVGDACVSCFFAADKTKAREEDLERVFGLASSYFSSLSPNNQSQTTTVDFDSRAALQAAADRLHAGPHPVPCFHWEIEFPEVFARENGGFDAFVGNPPFLGGWGISGAMGGHYLDFIVSRFPASGGQADLVAYFFRQAFNSVRGTGSIGLIATNTIAQGDTRATGLTWICLHGGIIYSAEKRCRWPGQASIIVSIIHILKSGTAFEVRLDGRVCSWITAFLFHRGGHEAPAPLLENQEKCFKGVDIGGMGFTFDDTEKNGIASPLSALRRIIEQNPASEEVIAPFLGAEEINNDAEHAHHRYVIDFGESDLEEAQSNWPELFAIVEEKVKPVRMLNNREIYRRNWWLFAERRVGLRRAIEGRKEMLACALHSKHLSIAVLSSGVVCSHGTAVFALEGFHSFAVLQSRPHEVWTRFFGSSMKDDLRYTPTDCFATFPFPVSTISELSFTGESYFRFRREEMRAAMEGLTPIYNRFHSPDERDPGILELRRLHGEMDVAVLRAYGWDDLADQAAQPDFCQFLLDYEVDEDDSASDTSSTRQKKKPWRYRWPDDFRDEVLARLLELNEQRHKEELLHVKGKSTEAKPAKKTSKKPAKASATPLLDGLDLVELSRDERLILLIVDSFKRITRTAVDQAFIAMKYPKLRKSRLGLGEAPKSVPRTDPGRDALIGGLVDQGFLEKHPSDYQQIWKLGSNAPSLAPTAAERQALEETQAIFQKSIDAGDTLASCTEGVTDAKPGLVSMA